ncbi:MAG: glutamyl-tRNA amidotransferase [Syntrophomonadaceae bacterium]
MKNLFRKSGQNEANQAINHTLAERKIQRGYIMAAVITAAMFGFTVTAYAADDPLGSINKLSDFVFAAIRAIGVILLGFGIVQIGLSLKSHDPGQRANGFMTFFGGIVIAFAKEILDMIL